MHTHVSHLFPSLDVSCFFPLKHLNGQEFQKLVRLGIHQIDKDELLSIYSKAHMVAVTNKNIRSGFQATGLILYNPRSILSYLTVTKIHPQPGTANGHALHWTSETPRTLTQPEE